MIEIKDDKGIARMLIAADTKSLRRSLSAHVELEFIPQPYLQTVSYFGQLDPDYEWISMIDIVLKKQSGNIIDMLRFGDPAVADAAVQWREFTPGIVPDEDRMDQIAAWLQQHARDRDSRYDNRVIATSSTSDCPWSDPWSAWSPQGMDELSIVLMSPALPRGVCAFRGVPTLSFLHPRFELRTKDSYAWEYTRQGGWVVLDGDIGLDPDEMSLTMDEERAAEWGLNNAGFFLSKKENGEWDLSLEPYRLSVTPAFS